MSDGTRHVIVEDEVLAQGFTQIPNLILRRPDLSPGAKLTYMVLLSYAWRSDSCYPGQDRLASDMGCSERSIITYLKQLQESQLVTIQRRGLGLTNVYILHRLARSENIAAQEVQDSTGLEVQNLQPKNTQEKKTKDEEDQSRSRKAPPLYDKDRETLLPYLEDFSRQLGDSAPLAASLSRAVNLYRKSGLDLDTFIDQLYQARAVTLEHSGQIKGKELAGEWGRKSRMSYFFACLEERVLG